MKYRTVWRNYFGDPERYADVINGICANGKQKICADDLEECDTQYAPVKVDENGNKAGEYIWAETMQRDVIRKVVKGSQLAIFGTESQEWLDYEIVLRVMKYDIAEYEKQAAEIRKKVKQEKGKNKPAEYMYGFRKEDKLNPVVTFVLYGGMEPWDGPYSLHDMLDISDFSDEFRDLIPDYKINIIELRNIEDTSVFKTDFRYVVEAIKVANDRKKLEELVRSEPYFQNMDPVTFDVIAAYVRKPELIGIKRKCIVEGGRISMCKAIDEMIQEGIEQGKIIGFIITSREYGASEDDIVSKLVTRFQMNEEQAKLQCEKSRTFKSWR